MHGKRERGSLERLLELGGGRKWSTDWGQTTERDGRMNLHAFSEKEKENARERVMSCFSFKVFSSTSFCFYRARPKFGSSRLTYAIVCT
jgi:hypothetical protein